MYNDQINMHFFPKTPKFFDLFDKLAKKVELSGKLLHENHLNSSSIAQVAKKLRKLELEADDICHYMNREADATFIPPIDREDIHKLSHNLDTIIDCVENSQSLSLIFRLGRPKGLFLNYIEAIAQATKQVSLLVQELRHGGKNIAKMKKYIIKIHALENEGDELLRKSYTKLFSNHKPLIAVIKWKDIYKNLEDILDQCEATSDTIEEIIIKNF